MTDKKARHPNLIAGLSGRDFGKAIVNLRFDTMADILGYLVDGLRRMAASDEEKGMSKLPFELRQAANHLKFAVDHIDNAWTISKSRTVTDEDIDMIEP